MKTKIFVLIAFITFILLGCTQEIPVSIYDKIVEVPSYLSGSSTVLYFWGVLGRGNKEGWYTLTMVSDDTGILSITHPKRKEILKKVNVSNIYIGERLTTITINGVEFTNK